MCTNLFVARFGIIHKTPSAKMKFHWTKQGFPWRYAGTLEFPFNNYENLKNLLSTIYTVTLSQVCSYLTTQSSMCDKITRSWMSGLNETCTCDFNSRDMTNNVK